MRTVSFLLAISITYLSACAPEVRKPVTRRTVEIHSRDYPGISPEQVLKASETVFKLADKGKFIFERDSSGFVAKRPLGSLVFSSTIERWKVEAKDERLSTVVSVSAEFDREGAKTMPNGLGAYHLFFSRLDYLLGISNQWMTCGEYGEQALKDPSWGNQRFLCIHANDEIPKGYKSGGERVEESS